jgi:hypothetical protein
MLNDVHEPPLEDEFQDRLHHKTRADKIDHPVLSPAGDPIANVELYGTSIPDHTFVGGIAMAVAAGILLVIFAIVMWAWL